MGLQTELTFSLSLKQQPTPSLMHFIGQDLIQSKILASDSSLRVLAFGGESCPTLSTLRAWRPAGSKTLMYNLYGITEVSCWASCYHIPNDQLEFREIASEADNGNCREKSLDDFPVGIVSDVPLGLPLSNTLIEIRDEKNELIKEGIGQIYIGEITYQNMNVNCEFNKYDIILSLCVCLLSKLFIINRE